MTDVQRAVDQFYSLKSAYEKQIETSVRDIRANQNLSRREKRAAYQKMEPPKCINCWRPVGTLFDVSTSAETAKRVFQAKCGDSQSPCPLKILVSMDTRHTFDIVMDEDHRDIESLKVQIIRAKNNLLFGFVDEQAAYGEFDRLTQLLTDKAAGAGKVIEDSIMRLDNPKSRESLKRDWIELETRIRELKTAVSSGNPALAAEIYVTAIAPLATRVREATYAVNEVNSGENGDTHTFQAWHSLPQREYDFGLQEDKVEALVVGMPRGTGASDTKPKKVTHK